MKRVTVTFDFEGRWGMPHKGSPYDLPATTQRLLEVLGRHQAKAVFFVTAKLIQEHPQVILDIHAAGHEIGFHGYEHEHMHELGSAQLAGLSRNLQATARELEALVGYRPRGFRAPYLMGPKFYAPAVYRALAASGFTWVSNREIRWPQELFRPDRLRLGLGLLRFGPLHDLLLALLNLTLLRRENRATGLRGASLAWLLGGRAPFERPEGLLEVPLYAPLDCDLLGFPLPHQASGERWVAYAAEVFKQCFDRSGDYFNLNCHDWIIGTDDRLRALDEALAYIATKPGVQYYLPGRDHVAATGGAR